MMMPGRGYQAKTGYRYGFNGKEKDNEVKGEGNQIAFEDRIYNPTLGRFLSTDPLYNKFPYFSPYLFAGNSPISSIDVKGDSLYILFYTVNFTSINGEDMFHAAAITRSWDIKHSKNFDPSRDKVVVIGVSDLSHIKNKVQETTADYSKTFGKTAEFGIWSHASYDGPVGSVDASEDNAGWGTNQMTLDGWSKINFNWENNGENCRALINGCRTGEMPSAGKASFVTKLSALSNFRNVTIQGPSTFSEPSKYVDKTVPTGATNGNRIVNMDKDGNVEFHQTYMVPVFSTKHQWFKDHETVQPMKNSKNGKGNLAGYQAGEKAPH